MELLKLRRFFCGSLYYSTGEPVSTESEIVSVFSLVQSNISEITRLKIRSSGFDYPN